MKWSLRQFAFKKQNFFLPVIINKIKIIIYLGIIVIVIKQGFRPLPNVHGRSMSFLNGCLKLFMFFLELFGLGQGAGDWEAGGQHPLGTVDPTDYLKSWNYVTFQLFISLPFISLSFISLPFISFGTIFILRKGVLRLFRTTHLLHKDIFIT